MRYNRFLFSLLLLLASYNIVAQIQANEWCPKGTWWAYTEQDGLFYKDRTYSIYVYSGDTIISNYITKKIAVYRTGTSMVYQGSANLDSILAIPRLNYYMYFQNRNDSVFIRSNDSLYYVLIDSTDSIYGTRRYSYLDTTFKFYYKVKFAQGENVVYKDTAGKNCTNHFPYYYYDTMINVKSIIDTYVNNQGKTRYLKTYQNKFKQNRFLYYDNIYHNMVPAEKLNKVIRLDSINSYIKNTFNDSLCERRYGENPWKTPRIQSLMCYFQGNQGYLIDDYFKGNYKSGCNYLKSELDKSRISNPTISLNVIIYPNPFNDYIIVENFTQKLLNFTLQGMDGKLLNRTGLNRATNRIVLDSISSGTYLLYILNSEGQVLKYEKIIKN